MNIYNKPKILLKLHRRRAEIDLTKYDKKTKMTELKTLKDFEAIDESFKTDEWFIERNNVLEELKSEAVKWVKETKKYQGEFSFGSARDWIEHFFNLTEEDLK